MTIRPLTAADLDAVLAIEAASPEAATWGRRAYENVIAPTSGISCVVAELEGVPVGFICYRLTGREAELLNLAVLPASRRRGIASLLLDQVLAHSARDGASEMFLEIRESNTAAQQFYRRFGFQLNGRRPRYYSNPPEDALILRRNLQQSEPRA